MQINIDFDSMEIRNKILDIDKYKKLFEESKLIRAGKFSKGVTYGSFDENLWALSVENKDTFLFLDFDELELLKFKSFSDFDINVLKC